MQRTDAARNATGVGRLKLLTSASCDLVPSSWAHTNKYLLVLPREPASAWAACSVLYIRAEHTYVQPRGLPSDTHRRKRHTRMIGESRVGGGKWRMGGGTLPCREIRRRTAKNSKYIDGLSPHRPSHTPSGHTRWVGRRWKLCMSLGDEVHALGSRRGEDTAFMSNEDFIQLV